MYQMVSGSRVTSRTLWLTRLQSLITGVFLMQCILRACQHLEGDLQWQIPFALITIFPTYVSIALYFCPESPRWLLLKGRDEDARKALHALHGKRPGGFDVDLELELMRDAIRDEPGQGQWRELVQGANKKRLVVVLALYFFLQATGQGKLVLSLVAALGLTLACHSIHVSVRRRLCSTTGIFQSVRRRYLSALEQSADTRLRQHQHHIDLHRCRHNWLLPQSLLHYVRRLQTHPDCITYKEEHRDRFGRKSLLMISVFLMGCILMTMGGLGVPDVQTKPMKNAIVACQVIFAFLYVVCLALPLQGRQC